MLEETVVAQRVVYDEIRRAGMDVKKIPIRNSMIASVRSASSAYKAAQAAKQTQQNAEENRLKDERKRKAPISNLEQQKKIKVDEMKSHAAELDKQIAIVKSDLPRNN
jgi:hypothetical protein